VKKTQKGVWGVGCKERVGGRTGRGMGGEERGIRGGRKNHGDGTRVGGGMCKGVRGKKEGGMKRKWENEGRSERGKKERGRTGRKEERG